MLLWMSTHGLCWLSSLDFYSNLWVSCRRAIHHYAQLTLPFPSQCFGHPMSSTRSRKTHAKILFWPSSLHPSIIRRMKARELGLAQPLQMVSRMIRLNRRDSFDYRLFLTNVDCQCLPNISALRFNTTRSRHGAQVVWGDRRKRMGLYTLAVSDSIGTWSEYEFTRKDVWTKLIAVLDLLTTILVKRRTFCFKLVELNSRAIVHTQ